VPGGLRGRSLVALFRGGSIAKQGLYAEALYPRYHFGWSDLYALTDARYRFIRAPRDELYDLAEDAGERRNLAEARSATRVAMRQGLERLLAGRQADQPAEVAAEDRERLRALGYVATQAGIAAGTGADALPDPKDRVHVLQQYREALELVRNGEIPAAMAVFERIVAENPAMADVWSEIAGLLVRQGRLEEALAAYKRLVETAPFDPAAVVSVSQTLIELGRLDEAVAQAELALTLLPASEGRWRAAAHKMLMRVALERNDTARARLEARRGQDADPSMPLVEYAEGLIRFRAGQFAEAVPHLQAALDQSASRTFQIPDLRYYLGDALGRLERHAEAERQFLDELRLFPGSLRAASGLAMLYRVQDRVDESNAAIETMLRRTPTPQAYALAAKLWTMFGETGRAAMANARARRPASQQQPPPRRAVR
jgi:tetratricopeptide (TPR) repeat protein